MAGSFHGVRYTDKQRSKNRNYSQGPPDILDYSSGHSSSVAFFGPFALGKCFLLDDSAGLSDDSTSVSLTAPVFSAADLIFFYVSHMQISQEI